MSDTLEKLNTIFCEVFDDEDIVLTRAVTAADIPAWDSLMHVTLILSVERSFGIRFRSGEVAGLKDVGELLDLIDRKRA